MKAPERGEVWLVDLGMAAKVRPALAISLLADDTDRALVTLVAHTTSPRSSRFEVVVTVPFLRAGVFDAQALSRKGPGRAVSDGARSRVHARARPALARQIEPGTFT